MATTTPNYGWPVPTSTDLVKDGATAIETLGDAIDASLLDLKGGTTGQLLTKNSNTDMDFIWSTPASGSLTTLATGTCSGTSIVLNSISQLYKSLYFTVTGLSYDSDNRFRIRFNGDSNSRYLWRADGIQTFSGDTTYSTGVSLDTYLQLRGANNLLNTSTNSNFALTIPNYTNTTRYKLINGVYAFEGNQPEINMFDFTGFYDAQSATGITSLSFGSFAASSMDAGTYTLYGVN